MNALLAHTGVGRDINYQHFSRADIDAHLAGPDFQLVPAGLEHDVVKAASACMVYLRGDAQLQVLPTA